MKKRVAVAVSRFNEEVRARVRARYLDAIDSWRDGCGYRIPGEFVIAAAVAPTQLHFNGETSWDS